MQPSLRFSDQFTNSPSKGQLTKMLHHLILQPVQLGSAWGGLQGHPDIIPWELRAFAQFVHLYKWGE